MLILYQGLKQNRFYWEFINTLRKVLLLMSLSLSLTLKVLSFITILIGSARIQIRLKPYKRNENNTVELLAIAAGVVTTLCGFMFSQTETIGFINIIFLILIMIINIKFILEWTYLMINCNRQKYIILNKVAVVFEMLLCKSKNKKIDDFDKNRDKPLKEDASVLNLKSRRNTKKKLIRGKRGRRSQKKYQKRISREKRVDRINVREERKLMALDTKLEKIRCAAKHLNDPKLGRSNHHEEEDDLRKHSLAKDNPDNRLTNFNIFEIEESNSVFKSQKLLQQKVSEIGEKPKDKDKSMRDTLIYPIMSVDAEDSISDP